MPYYALTISADLDNLTDLQPQGGCDDPEYRYYFKVKCSCGEICPKELYVTLEEKVPAPNGRGTCNFVMKCKGCSRDGSIEMIPGQGSPLSLDKSQSHKSSYLMVFECRGFEPIEFSFRDGWMAQSTSGTKFEIDLREGEFAEYDEKSGFPVGLTDLKAEFVTVRKVERYGRTYYA